MNRDDKPFEYEYDLGDLGRNGTEITLEADAEDRARIAAWAEVPAVESFGAKVHLRKHSANRFALDADLVADVVQDCVVTLEPVKSRIERHVHRELHVAHHTRLKPNEVIPLGAGAGDDEVPEEIVSLEYDVAGPLLEEFTLALDPYPRAPGVEFAAPAALGEAEPARENPFAVLKGLKNRP
ncbi:MAG: hypothetical protein ISS15_20245 [Alphaproteobacteria bacterium]|nr:hypothetical protein [Alphaproteobacteria bacterium]MBL7099994.1 hypothetical protein [Alphaproteobacteria bacterium]